MARVIASLLLIFSSDFFIFGLPVNRGLNIKFRPLHTKDEIHPKTFGTLFAKIPQEMTPEAILRRELLSKTFPIHTPELGVGCSNQIARRLFPVEDNITFNLDRNITEPPPTINLPFPHFPDNKDFKVLVAAAPPDFKLGRREDSENILVYIVFPFDGNREGESNSVSMPKVFFVNTRTSPRPNIPDDMMKPSENLLLVNNNRTVTGIKSKQLAKSLKFNNKLVNRYNYEIVPNI